MLLLKTVGFLVPYVWLPTLTSYNSTTLKNLSSFHVSFNVKEKKKYSFKTINVFLDV